LQKIYDDYKDQVDFFWVYAQEARSSDTGLAEGKDKNPLKSIKNHRTIEERKASALQCAKELSTTIPQLIDDLDNSTTIRYHGHPTRLYLIGNHNKINYAGKPGPFGTNLTAFANAVKKQAIKKQAKK